jgi:hypothetical protein
MRLAAGYLLAPVWAHRVMHLCYFWTPRALVSYPRFAVLLGVVMITRDDNGVSLILRVYLAIWRSQADFSLFLIGSRTVDVINADNLDLSNAAVL